MILWSLFINRGMRRKRGALRGDWCGKTHAFRLPSSPTEGQLAVSFSWKEMEGPSEPGASAPVCCLMGQRPVGNPVLTLRKPLDLSSNFPTLQLRNQAQSSDGTCPKSHSKLVLEVELESGLLSSSPAFSLLYRAHLESGFRVRESLDLTKCLLLKLQSGSELLPADSFRRPSFAQGSSVTCYRHQCWRRGQLEERWWLLVQIKVLVAPVPAPPLSIEHRPQRISKQYVFPPLLNWGTVG